MNFQFRLFAMARSVSNGQNGKTVCTVLNYNSQTLVLKKEVEIATVKNITALEICVSYVRNYGRSSVAAVSMLADTDDTRVDLDNFLEEYKF